MRARLLIVAIVTLFSGLLAAQETPPPVTLIADSIEVEGGQTLVVRGNIEAVQGQIRLQAREIRFNSETGQLEIIGPIRIEEGSNVLVLADEAELSRDLRNGLLVGARMILGQQLQLAANQMSREDGRYTQLYKAVATSCKVCEDGRPPLWSIRAERVVHDLQGRQLYFDSAQFRIGNVPVFYVPRLRLPDPTLRRASGFLSPSLRSTSQLGTGVKVPYFIRLGDHRDLTLTPYISSQTRSLEFRYRQAFTNGNINFRGAVTRDDLRPGEVRGYLFGAGQFDLGQGYKLSFDVEATSDDAYLNEYEYADKDRLDSAITITRAERNELRRLGFVNFRTLRDGEDNETLPTNVLTANYERRVHPSWLDGELRLSAEAHGHFRNSGLGVDGPDPGSEPDGRDVVRLTTGAHWLRDWNYRSGIEVQSLLGVEADVVGVAQDDGFPSSDQGMHTQAALTARYPLVRRSSTAVQTLEPVVQIGWVGGSVLNVPNEQSTRVEFDEGNLLSLSRFPHPDRRERGTTLTTGLNWSRISAKGWQTHLSFGSVVRNTDIEDYSIGSGLSGFRSDLLVAGQVNLSGKLALAGRALIGEDLDASKAELRGDWFGSNARLGGSYIWLMRDREEDRFDPISELNLDGDYEINDRWSATANWRYDIQDNRAAHAGLGVVYNNECVSARFGVNRRYATSTSVEPSTNLGFTVALRGFSAQKGTESYARACK